MGQKRSIADLAGPPAACLTQESNSSSFCHAVDTVIEVNMINSRLTCGIQDTALPEKHFVQLLI
jgi:hypothetical protein